VHDLHATLVALASGRRSWSLPNQSSRPESQRSLLARSGGIAASFQPATIRPAL